MGTPNPTGSDMSESTTTETDSTATSTDATSTEDAKTTETATDSGKDWQAEAEKWKSLSRKHEDSAKANADKAKRFEEFEESQKTEQQKLADDRDKAKAEAASTAAELARVKAAVKHGLTEDDLELLGTHGTAEEIDARAEKLAARIKAADAGKPKPDFGGGDRGGDVTSTGADALNGQIDEATKAGNFQLAIALKQQRSALLAEKKS
jgi:hypothetical protein